MTDPLDFKALAEEAARTAYDPRAERCWPWSHEWTMWQPNPGGRHQKRRCVRCGVSQGKRLSAVCAHDWRRIDDGRTTNKGGEIIGFWYMYRCSHCCEGKTVRTSGDKT